MPRMIGYVEGETSSDILTLLFSSGILVNSGEMLRIVDVGRKYTSKKVLRGMSKW